MKKIIVAFLVMLHFTAGYGVNVQAKTKITYWTMQLAPTFNDYFNKIKKDYEKEHPNIEIDWVDVPWSGMEQKVLTAQASGDVPDVVNLNPQSASKIAHLGGLYQLNNVLTQRQKDVYFPKIWNGQKVNGKAYMLPWYLTNVILFYNKNILKSAGVDKIPTNFTELFASCKKIKAKTGKYCFMPTFDGTILLASMVSQGFVVIDPKTKKAGFDNPKGREIFQYYVDLYKNKLIPPEVLTEGHTKQVQFYQISKIAYMETGATMSKNLKTNALDIYNSTGVTFGRRGETGLSSVAVMNFVVMAKSKHPKEALEFALYLTNNANQVSFAKTTKTTLASTVDSLKDPYFSGDEKDESQSLEKRATLISAKQLPHNSILVSPDMKNLNKIKKAIYDNLQLALIGNQSVDDAIKKAAQTVNKYSK